jgi:Ca-activated chloride channel family protein
MPVTRIVPHGYGEQTDLLPFTHAPDGAERDGRTARELMYVKLRYKEPNGSKSIPFDHVVANRVTEPSTDFRFALAVAAFGMSLRESAHRGSATAEMALDLANGALGSDSWGYRREFVQLVSQYLELGDVARVRDNVRH